RSLTRSTSGRQFLAPVVVGREEVRLMLAGGNQVEQHDADTQRFVAWHPLLELLRGGRAESRCHASRENRFHPTSRRDRQPRKDAGLTAGSSSRRGATRT